MFTQCIFCTFTCYKWIHLFSLTNGHNLAYNWFNVLKEDKIEIVGYNPIAIGMPNHVHCVLYLSYAGFSLNKVSAGEIKFRNNLICNNL